MALSDNLRGAIYMNCAMAGFTFNDAFMKAATETLPLYQAILMRGVLTGLALLALGLAIGGVRVTLPRRDAGIIALRSLAEVAGTALFLTALLHMPLANLSAILQFLPLAVTLAAALIYREVIGWRRMSAIFVGFLGILIIIRPGTDGFDVWSVLGLGAVVCVVVRDLATRRLSGAVPSVTVALWASASVSVMGAVGMAVQGWSPPTLSEALFVSAAASALVVGYMFSVMVMRVGDIGFVAPFRYTALLWAILLGWLIFGSLPDLWTVIGAAIVVTTGVFTLLRERRLARTPADLAIPPA